MLSHWNQKKGSEPTTWCVHAVSSEPIPPGICPQQVFRRKLWPCCRLRKEGIEESDITIDWDDQSYRTESTVDCDKAGTADKGNPIRKVSLFCLTQSTMVRR